MSKIQPRNAIKVTGIVKYVADKMKRQQTLFKITPEGKFYFDEDQLIPEKDFHEMYPMKLHPINYKGKNPDGTRI